MKNQKRVSGISYSRIVKTLLLLALIYGAYNILKDKKTKTPEELVQDATQGLVQLDSETPEEPLVAAEPSGSGMNESSLINETQLQEPKVWSVEEFQKLTRKTLQELPVLKDFRKLSQREVHHTPEIINRAGDQLGLIAETFEAHPQFAPEAQDFYHKCFERKDLPSAIRALCLANHRNMRASQGGSPSWEDKELRATSEEVRELAEQVPLK